MNGNLTAITFNAEYAKQIRTWTAQPGPAGFRVGGTSGMKFRSENNTYPSG
jgi:hypothetical protein